LRADCGGRSSLKFQTRGLSFENAKSVEQQFDGNNNSCLFHIKKLEQESVQKLETYDRITEELMSYVSENSRGLF
jgi:hypothetical protein